MHPFAPCGGGPGGAWWVGVGRGRYPGWKSTDIEEELDHVIGVRAERWRCVVWAAWCGMSDWSPGCLVMVLAVGMALTWGK